MFIKDQKEIDALNERLKMNYGSIENVFKEMLIDSKKYPLISSD